MKRIILLLIAIICSVSSFAQSHQAHDEVMKKFQTFYNANLADSIQTLFPHGSPIWEGQKTNKIHEQYGDMISMKYIGETPADPNVKIYKIKTTKKTFALGLSLKKSGKLENFRFETRSPSINALMETDTE
jgi:hypothetical protein